MAKIKKNTENRRFMRHPMCLPLTYDVLKKVKSLKPKGLKSKTINVSRGGLLFSAKKSIDTDSVILINIPFQNKTFKIKAKVVHCSKNCDTNLYSVGVAFLRPNEAFKVKLIEQMYLISEYRDLRSVELGKEISLQEASEEWITRYSKRFKRLYW